MKKLQYLAIKVINGLSPKIMKEVFNFHENENYNLRRGIQLASRNMHTAHFSTDTISSLGTKLWKLIPERIKHASTLSAFNTKITFGTTTNSHVDFAKYIGFIEVSPSL